MSKDYEKQIKELLKKGKSNYFLRDGLPFGIAFGAFFYFFEVGFVFDFIRLIIYLFAGLISGWLYSEITWWNYKRKFGEKK